MSHHRRLLGSRNICDLGLLPVFFWSASVGLGTSCISSNNFVVVIILLLARHGEYRCQTALPPSPPWLWSGLSHSSFSVSNNCKAHLPKHRHQGVLRPSCLPEDYAAYRERRDDIPVNVLCKQCWNQKQLNSMDWTTGSYIYHVNGQNGRKLKSDNNFDLMYISKLWYSTSPLIWLQVLFFSLAKACWQLVSQRHPKNLNGWELSMASCTFGLNHDIYSTL